MCTLGALCCCWLLSGCLQYWLLHVWTHVSELQISATPHLTPHPTFVYLFFCEYTYMHKRTHETTTNVYNILVVGSHMCDTYIVVCVRVCYMQYVMCDVLARRVFVFRVYGVEQREKPSDSCGVARAICGDLLCASIESPQFRTTCLPVHTIYIYDYQ